MKQPVCAVCYVSYPVYTAAEAIKPTKSKCLYTLYDTRAQHIERLRSMISSEDWSSVLSCADVYACFDVFVNRINSLICTAIPSRNIVLRASDPDFVTPLVRSLPNRRCKLRLQGRISEANIVAGKVNRLISEFRQHRFENLANSSSSQLWKVVYNKSNTVVGSSLPGSVDAEALNAAFAAVSTDIERTADPRDVVVSLIGHASDASSSVEGISCLKVFN